MRSATAHEHSMLGKQMLGWFQDRLDPVVFRGEQSFVQWRNSAEEAQAGSKPGGRSNLWESTQPHSGRQSASSAGFWTGGDPVLVEFNRGFLQWRNSADEAKAGSKPGG